MSISTNNNTLNEILSMINNLPSADGSGGGMVYTNIVYNDDNTVTLTDKDGVDHTMVCEYTDGVLSGLTYDGKSVELTYEEDALVNIGTVEVDMANVPIESGGTDEIITITTAITNTLEAYNTFSAFMNEGENIAVFASTKKLDEITAGSYGVYAVIGAGEKGAFYRNQAENTIINIVHANYDFRISAGDTFKKVVLF